jgi:hypothetical protein
VSTITAAIDWPIVPALDDIVIIVQQLVECMTGKGNRSTRRKSAPASLWPPKISRDFFRARTWAVAMENRRLLHGLTSVSQCKI